MLSLVELLSKYDGEELTVSDYDALSAFVKKHLVGYEVAKRSTSSKSPKLPLGVEHFDGAPHNPITGYELSGDRFCELLDLNNIGQYATKMQWESVGRKTIGAPSIRVSVYGKEAVYYAIEGTKEA